MEVELRLRIVLDADFGVQEESQAKVAQRSEELLRRYRQGEEGANQDVTAGGRL